MKKIVLLTFSILFIAFVAQAQINKGAVMLGGGISLSKGKSASETNGTPNNSSSSQFNTFIYPTFGIAIKQNTVAGINLNYRHAQDKANNSPSETKQQTYGAGLFVRRYMPLGKNFYLFGEAALGYYKSKYTYEVINNNTPYSKQQNNNTSVSLHLYPGISYAVSQRFQLEVSINNLFDLSYNKTEQTIANAVSTTYKSNNKGVSLTTNASNTAPLTVGFRIFINKKEI